MSVTQTEWLDEVLEALAKARATLASFGARDRALEKHIDAAMRWAHMLKTNAFADNGKGEAA